MTTTNELVWIDDLDADVCWRLLADAVIARVGFVLDGDPTVLPVTYVVDGRTIVFRTAQTSLLEAMAGGAVVAFELDGADAFAETGWSVLLRGTADEVVDPAERAVLERLPLRPWAPGLRDHWIRIRPTTVTGRAISHRGGAAVPTGVPDPCHTAPTGVE